MNLADWMNENNISDNDLEKAIGVTRSYVSRIRRGKVEPNLGVALTIWRYSDRVVDLESMLPHHMRDKFQRRWARHDKQAADMATMKAFVDKNRGKRSLFNPKGSN
jgi:transcriptional regulator with XRE-family HTH domain